MGKMCWRLDSCLRFFMHFRDIKLILRTEFLLSVLQMSRRGNVTSISSEKWVSNLNLKHFPVQKNVCSAFDFLAINYKYKIKWTLCFVKEQRSFSWDWGPSFPTMGLWKEVRLVPFDVLHLIQLSSVPLYGGYLFPLCQNIKGGRTV